MDEQSDLLADAFSEAAQRLFWKGIPELTEIPWEEALLRQEHHGEEIEGCPDWPSLGSCTQSTERLELNFSAPVAPTPLWGQVLRDGPWTPTVQPATPGSWVWQNETRLHFWPDLPLAPATDFQIQGWNFRTEILPVQISPPPAAWDPLRLESAGQEVRDEFRTDLSIQFTLRWNNPLDRDRFSPHWVQVSPELKGLRVFACDEKIYISGRGQAGCYEVDVCEKLQDARGQFLGGTAFAKFKIQRSPWFLFPAQPLQVMPRHHPPYFRCYSLGWSELLCRVMPVEPADWERYQSSRDRPEGRIQAWQRRYWEFPLRPERLDRFETLAMDLTAYMEGGSGHLLLEVTIPEAESSGKIPLGRKNFKSPGHDQSHTYGLIWLSYPELGLAAYADPGRTLLLSVLAQTGRQHGLQTISPGGPLRAELDSRQALLASVHTPAWDGTRLWVWLDRQKFRPGETVHAVGCWRRLERPDGTLQIVGPTTMSVAWWPCASYEKKRSQSPISESGHFSFELELPHDTPIGKHELELEVPGGARAQILSFEVEEYPAPDFQVELSAQQRGPLWHFRAVARDRSGRPLESAQIQWKLVTQAVACRPPGWSEFHFGEELPQDRWSPVEAIPPDDRQHKHQSGGLLSQQGEAEWQWLAQPYPEPPPPKRQPPPSRWGQGWRPRRAPQLEWRPALSGLRLSLKARVSSTLPSLPTAAEQVVQLECLAQTAEFCLGMRCQQRVYKPDQELCVQILVTDRQGNPVPGVRVELQVEGQKKMGEMTSRNRPQQLSFEAPPGLFVVRAWVRDTQGKVSLTRLHGYRLGTRPRPSKHSQLLCMLEQADYEVGDQAQLWVQAPASGTAVLRIGNGACCSEQIRHIDLGESCFDFPVMATMLPRATIRLELFGNERSGRPRCWVAEEQLQVVPPPALQVEVFQTRRDSEVDVFVTVTDPADGFPLEGASVSLLVVEEALLAEGLCKPTDPMERFYPTKPSRMGSHNSWDHYRQATLLELLKEAQEAEFRGKCVTLAAPRPQVARYTRWFAPPAHIAGCLTTSAEGVAATTFSLPHHPGPWRILAAAIYGIDRCGSAQQPLSVPSDWRLEVRWPAFVRAGDELELELEVQNHGRESHIARIDLRGLGFHLHEPGGVELELPPERSAELTFPLRAGLGPCLQFQILVKVAGQQQLLEHRLPVRPPHQGWRWLLCEDLARQILAGLEQVSRPPEFDLWCRLLRRRKRGNDFVTHWGERENEAVGKLAEHALLRAEGQSAEPLEITSPSEKGPADLWLSRRLQARDESDPIELLAENHWRISRGARVRLVLEILSLECLDRLYLWAPLAAALEPLVGSPTTYPWRSLWTRPVHPGHRPFSSREDGWRCVEVSAQGIEACALGLPVGRSQLVCECWATQAGRFWMPPALLEDLNNPSYRIQAPGCWIEVV